MYKKLEDKKFLELYPIVILKHNQVYQCNYDQINNVTLPIVTVNYPVVINFYIDYFFLKFLNYISI